MEWWWPETFYLAKETGYKLLLPPGIPFPTFNTKAQYDYGPPPIESVLYRLEVLKTVVAKDLKIFFNGESTPFEVIAVQQKHHQRQEKFAKGTITIFAKKGIFTFFVRRANLNIYYMAITCIEFEEPCQEGSKKKQKL